MAQVANFLLDFNTNILRVSIISSSGQQVDINENIYGNGRNVQYSVFSVIVDNLQYKWANKSPQIFNLLIGIKVFFNNTTQSNIFLFLGERNLKTLNISSPLRLIIVENLSPRCLVPSSQSYSRVLLEAFGINGNFYHELRSGRYAQRSQQFIRKARNSQFLNVMNLNQYFVINKNNNFLEICGTKLIKAIMEALF